MHAFAQTPTHYLVAYDGVLRGDWVRSCWENSDGALATNFSASAPGRTGNAIEVRFGAANSWNAFGLGNQKPGWDLQWLYLNEFRTIEFDLYFASDSTGEDNLTFLVEDGGYSDDPTVGSLIPGWAGMTNTQRRGHWFHVVADLSQIHVNIPRFERFEMFNGADAANSRPHFYVMNVQLGWVDDTTAPVITLNSTAVSLTNDQLTLNFSTDKATIFHVDYGRGSYDSTVQGDPDDWNSSHAAVLPSLTPGASYQYRIVAQAHRTDPNATPVTATLAGTYTLPAAPTSPPVISSLAAGGVSGNRATLTWNTNRPCNAQVVYHKVGGPDLTRTAADFAATRSFVLDLLEPSASYTAIATVTDAFGLSSSQTVQFATSATVAATVTITADPAHTRAISPWIYGINFYEGIPGNPRNLTLNRAGGNRWTAYNWENNASNAGSDWYYSSDDYLGGGNTPAEAVRSIVDWSRAHGAASLLTFQLQGYVSADKNGTVDLNDPNHLAARFKQVVFQKGSAFTATPPTTDASVYMDEFLWALRGKFSGDIYSDAATPTFVSLDNEPELWPSTHAEIQSTPPDPEDYIQRTVALCTALKNADPAVKLFGPVHYGFNGIANWQGVGNFTDTYWFTDKYLQELKTASTAAGRRLLDVYDIHWYSEAYAGSDRVTSLTGSNLTDQQVQAIVQSPRSLWDPTYTEDSWIADYLGGAVRILDRLQTKIDADWPGTELAVTEYANGGDNHIAGAIAEADNLGIFGSRGVFAATYWPLTSDLPFILAGFKMYRDYDGSLSTFGDVSIPTVSSDTAAVAVYVSQDSRTAGRYVLVAINRSTTSQDVGFRGLAVSGTARIYRVAGTSPVPAFVGEVPADLASWVVTLPALSVSTIELAGGSSSAAPAITLQPVNRTLTAGGAAAFTVNASGTPAPVFRWQRQAAGTSTWIDLANGGAYSGTGTTGLTVDATTLAMSGDGFRCVASNQVGSATSNAATLTVQAAPLVGTAPTITSANHATFTIGVAGRFTVTASGTPAPTYQAGGLPAWASLNSASGVLGGTPPNATGAPFVVTFTASNGTAPDATQSFTLNVQAAADTTPDGIAFTDVTGAELSTVCTSNEVTVGGISAAAAMSITGGSYSINDGAYVTATGSVNGGDRVTVRLTSSASYATRVSASLTIGGVSDSFDVTTRAATAPGVGPWLTVSTLAGQTGTSGSADGTGPAARLFAPADVAVDAAGNIYIADTDNHTIRKATPSGVVTTLAGQARTSGSADGTGTAARFNHPTGVAVDGSGNVFVADTDNATIRRINSVGAVTTLAGQAGAPGNVDGTGATARFNGPSALAVDAGGNLYVSDTLNNRIRQVTVAGAVTTLAAANGLSGPQGLALDGAGNLYVADTNSRTIRKLMLAAGTMTVFAGQAGVSGGDDGAAGQARFNFPSGIAVDSGGTIYVADTDNHAIRQITPAGVVSTIAGQAGASGSVDGVGAAARFNHPTGIAVSTGGDVYIADTDNHTLRLGIFPAAPAITAQPQSQTVVAGSGVQFSVTASGKPAPNYQWLLNGATINGATSSTLSLANVQAANAGSYTVTVTNTSGSVTSNVATLTVNAASTPPPPSGGGGGGTVEAWFVVVLALLGVVGWVIRQR